MKIRWLVIAIAAGVIALLYSLGFFDAFSSLTAVQETVQGFGVSGPIIYVLVFALGEPFGVAGIILTIAAALVWPWYFAFMLSWAGTLGASAFGLWFARYVGRDFVQKRLPARLNKYNKRLEETPLKTVIIIRLILFLAPGVHFFFGVSRVPFVPFMVGSLIGFFPGVFLFSFFAGEVADFFGG